MLPLLGGLITGGASLLGSMFSSQTSAQNTQEQIQAQEAMQQQTMDFNEQERARSADVNQQFLQEAQGFDQSMVSQQEGFQQQMSNTAYQRASADMKAAGLNPMMMFGSGGAASTPSGAAISSPSASSPMASVGTPSVPMPQKTSMVAGLGPAVNNVVSTAVQAKTFDKLTEEIANLQTQEARTEAETATEGARKTLIGNQAAAAGYGVTTAQAVAERAKRYIDMPDWLKNAVEYTQYGAGGVKSVGDAIVPLVNSATGVGRIGQAFEDIASSRQRRSIDQGNFIGKYGVPVDEYLAQ